MKPTREKNAKVWAKHPDDWYVEPGDCTTALLTVEGFVGDVHDPACGGGNIVKALLAADVDASGSDIRDRVTVDGVTPEWFSVSDFLAPLHHLTQDDLAGWQPTNIICNPPFRSGKGTTAFIQKALSMRMLAKLAIFTDIRFLGSDTRARGLHATHPPTRIWWLTPRPSCPPGDYIARGGKVGGGQPDFCWMVWDRLSPAQAMPNFGWLRRNAEPDK